MKIGINDYLHTISVNCKLHAYNPHTNPCVTNKANTDKEKYTDMPCTCVTNYNIEGSIKLPSTIKEKYAEMPSTNIELDKLQVNSEDSYK